ncbi:MAG: glycoside hydrolase family 13 protein [Lachnospiraceae bacterium]|nr:glycoside hydrolase family 13 protein [Lachnospiraceae bacterium]
MADEQIKETFQPEAVFSDGTEMFRSPCEPEPYDTVTLRLRVGKDQAKQARIVITERSRCIEMVLTGSDERFDWYRAEVELTDRFLHYFFEIATSNGVFRYDRLGVMLADRETVPFRITPGFHTPQWAKGAVMYQIFVDRFCNGDPTNDVQTGEYYYIDRYAQRVTDWNRVPEAKDVQEFYGGDLRGVIKKLDYLRKLGVEVLYLNPIFVSPSSHKYDIQDYDHVDPHFGVIVKDAPTGLCEGDTLNAHSAQYVARVTSHENLAASNDLFAELVREAHIRGMRVIIDGVFNHCGSFNKWLDREGIYRNAEGFDDGAYGVPDSPYRSFFDFKKKPGNMSEGSGDGPTDGAPVDGYSADGKCTANGTTLNGNLGSENHPGNSADADDPYDGWWGHDTLPKLNYERSPKLKNYIMRIARKWISAPFGADGWRLDVAADLGHSEEYNHEFWKEFRRNVKASNPDALILAEHYGNAERWLGGDEWDSVMNYDAFMEPVSWFLTGMEKHSDAYREDMLNNEKAFDFAMRCNMARFQTASLQVAMNELSNHDHSRFLTRTNRQVGRTASVGAAAADEGVNAAVMREAVLIQMTWPGAPCVYYGDEAGVCGWTDPDNRRTYPWGHEDPMMMRFHREMIRLHRSYNSLRTGSLLMLVEEPGVLAFARMNEAETVITVVNNNEEDRDITIPVWRAGITDRQSLVRLIHSHRDGFGLDTEIYIPRDGRITICVAATGGVILKNMR